MTPNHSANIIRIKAIHNAFGGLKDSIVFVGGAVVSLYAERSAEDVRETTDVDILVEIYSLLEFSELEAKLRQIGFVNDTSSKFIGRFRFQKTTVDVMPLDEKILGFSNIWYKEGFKHAIAYRIDETVTIRIFTPPYFLASKLEAFKNRGKNKSGEYDGRQSDDFADIVYLLVNRPAIYTEIAQATGQLKTYLLKELDRWYSTPYFEEWIDAHTSYHSPVAFYTVIPRIRELLELR